MTLKAWIHYHKLFVRIVGVIVILLMIIIGTFLSWVIVEPRSLDQFNDYFKKQLNQLEPTYHFDIERSYIYWDSNEYNLHLKMTDLSIADEEQKPVASFPIVNFEFSLMRILVGKFISSSVTLEEPTFHLTTSGNTIYLKSKDQSQNFSYLLLEFKKHLQAAKRNFDLEEIKLNNASVIIDDGENHPIEWLFKNASFFLEKNKNGDNILVANLFLQFDKDHQTQWVVETTAKENGDIDITANITQLPSFVLQDLFPETDLSKVSDVIINGQFSTHYDADKKQFLHINFDLKDSSGVLDMPTYFPEKVTLNDINGAGVFDLSSKELTLHSLKTTLNKTKTTIELAGSFRNFLFNKTDALPELIFSTTISSLPTNDLEKYWPIPLRERLRSWITGHIRNGMIAKAQGNFTITEEDSKLLEKHSEYAEKFPDKLSELPLPPPEFLHATIELKDADIDYFSIYPKAENVDATITFDHKSMKAAITSANISDVALSKTHVDIDNLWLKPAYLKVESDIKGDAAVIARYLKASFKTDKTENSNPMLQPLYQMTGEVSGHIALGLPLLRELDYDDIELIANADFSNMTLPQFRAGYDINQSQFAMKLHNYDLSLQGTGLFAEAPFEANYTHYFSPKKEHPFIHQEHIKTSISSTLLNQLDLFELPYIEGNMGLDITATQTDKHLAIAGTADLNMASLALPDYTISKPVNTPAKLTFDSQFNESTLQVKSFALAGNNIDISGSLSLSMDDKNAYHIEQLNLPKFIVNRHNLSITQAQTKTGYEMHIKGSSADLSNSSFTDFFETGETLNRSVKMNANIDTMYMKNDAILHQFKMNMACGTDKCQAVDIDAKLADDGYLAVSLKPMQDRAVLFIESDNAGQVLRAFGISKHVEGGRLLVQSTAQRDADKRLLAMGDIKIENFRAVKTALLGKLLTLASLKGVTDLLNQQGITFDKFEAPFTLSKHIITVKDAKSSGSSLGITCEGTINTKTSELDLKGVVAPIQEVNKLINRIPVVGDIISGGKNEGIIATSYTISGPYEDAKISVNPLSILTPGFLRKIFDVF